MENYFGVGGTVFRTPAGTPASSIGILGLTLSSAPDSSFLVRQWGRLPAPSQKTWATFSAPGFHILTTVHYLKGEPKDLALWVLCPSLSFCFSIKKKIERDRENAHVL